MQYSRNELVNLIQISMFFFSFNNMKQSGSGTPLQRRDVPGNLVRNGEATRRHAYTTAGVQLSQRQITLI